MSDDENYNAEDGAERGSNMGEERTDSVDEVVPDKPLSPEAACECVSLLCKTGDGLSHAYVKLDARDRRLTDINILNSYIHLRYIDVSKNALRDISPLNALTHMLVLKADQNKLTSAELDELPYLQSASFNYNHIKNTEGLNHPQLEHLALNYNDITEVTGLDPSKLERLHTMELRGNKLSSPDGIYVKSLKNLFLGANQITSLVGIERLEHLATLHLRDNQIENLDGFSDVLKNLQYINLRQNNLSTTKEVKKLQLLPILRAAVFKDNPIAAEDDYRLEMLISLRRLERLDKDDYNDDERQEAEEIYEQRRQEEIQAQAEGAEEVIGDEDED